MARRYHPPQKRSRPPRATHVVVNGYSETWLRQGFCWVYPQEVEDRPPGSSSGDVVTLRSKEGQDLGVGIWDEGWIAVRRFHDSGSTIALAPLLEQARELRDRALPPETTAYRLVNAENDGLPGIRVDVYGWHMVLTLDSPSLLALGEQVADWLEAELAPRGIHLAWRRDPRDPERPLPREEGLLRGRPAPGDVSVQERGVKVLVRPQAGKDVGLFTDMRENRRWLEPHWGGRRVLNLFAHTGVFSVVAALGGASEVVSVDLSEPYLERARANFVANDLDPEAHSFLAEDCGRALDRFRRTGERFDLVLLDPPSFSHGPTGTFSAARDMPRLVAASLRVLEHGGWFVAASNNGQVSPRDFHGFIRDGSRKAGMTLQLLHEGGPPPDHPAAVAFPEGRYLKFAVWRVLGGQS